LARHCAGPLPTKSGLPNRSRGPDRPTAFKAYFLSLHAAWNLAVFIGVERDTSCNERTRCQKKTTLKACRIKVANTAGKKACLSQSPSHRKVPIRESSAMRGERSSRETKRAPSKFIGQIQTESEEASGDRRFIGVRPVRCEWRGRLLATPLVVNRAKPSSLLGSSRPRRSRGLPGHP
jgi:hypothetical protein